MSARVGRSGSEGQFCMQPRNVGLVGAPHRFPMTSTRVSAYFHACSCLWRNSSAASRRRSSSAYGTVPVITSRTIQESVGVVNDESDTGWIRAKRYFDQTVESIR